MDLRITCKECQEQLLLLFAGALSESEEKTMWQHVNSCEECREMSELERVLYDVSKIDKPSSPLTDHPESAMLDEYVFAKSTLAPEEIEKVENHIRQCGLCCKLVDQIRGLPTELDDLIDPKELPLLTRMAVNGQQEARIVNIGRRVLWHPLAGYAAAAAVLLTTILFRPSPVPESSAIVAGTIPSSLRGNEQVIVFESPLQQCYLDLKYHVAPEGGHQYDFEIRPEVDEKPLQSLSAFNNFDAQGNAVLRVLLDIGRYQLVIYDIAGSDTIKVVRSFELRFLAK